jgi:hypothetical protein
MATRTNFFAEKNDPRKCCNFADPQQINQKLLKPDIEPQTSPANAALNAENGTRDIVS